MTSKKSDSPPRDWEYYQEKFRGLFEEFARDVSVDQANDLVLILTSRSPGSMLIV
jgi:hypothetical protein